jgi:hypothetical protein
LNVETALFSSSVNVVKLMYNKDEQECVEFIDFFCMLFPLSKSENEISKPNRPNRNHEFEECCYAEDLACTRFLQFWGWRGKFSRYFPCRKGPFWLFYMSAWLAIKKMQGNARCYSQIQFEAELRSFTASDEFRKRRDAKKTLLVIVDCSCESEGNNKNVWNVCSFMKIKIVAESSLKFAI